MDDLGDFELSQEAFDSGLENLLCADVLLDVGTTTTGNTTDQIHRYETPLIFDAYDDADKANENEKRKISPDGVDHIDTVIEATNSQQEMQRGRSPPPISNSNKRKKLSKPQPSKKKGIYILTIRTICLIVACGHVFLFKFCFIFF